MPQWLLSRNGVGRPRSPARVLLLATVPWPTLNARGELPGVAEILPPMYFATVALPSGPDLLRAGVAHDPAGIVHTGHRRQKPGLQRGSGDDMEYAISLMTLADVDDVAEIEKQSFPIPWSRAAFVDELTRNARALYIVVRDESETTVGYGGMWLVCDEAHVTNIAVRSDRRRRGVGTAVRIGLMGLGSVEGSKPHDFEVRVSNRPAQELYSRLGFRPLGLGLVTIWITREDALTWA